MTAPSKDLSELTLRLCKAPLTLFLKKFVPKAIVVWFGERSPVGRSSGDIRIQKVFSIDGLIETSKSEILKHITKLSDKLIKSRKLPSGKYYHTYGKQLKTPSSRFFPIISDLVWGCYCETIDDEFSAKIKEWTEKVANN